MKTKGDKTMSGQYFITLSALNRNASAGLRAALLDSSLPEAFNEHGTKGIDRLLYCMEELSKVEVDVISSHLISCRIVHSSWLEIFLQTMRSSNINSM